jgi:ABC-type phosphate transport system substrate-binding protein
LLLVVVVVLGALLGAAPVASAAPPHALIQGSGSVYAANAVNQWIADEHASGLQVVFTANGSEQGRKDFAHDTTDYAVTDLPYQGAPDTSLDRSFAYVPLVAGGIAFPFHVEVGGQLLRSLHLSGATLAAIFAGQITNWDDPAIAADNDGAALPSLPIVPVVHSEQSAVSYQVSRYFGTEFGSTWTAGTSPYWPAAGVDDAVTGSSAVVNAVTSTNGAIGMDETPYTLGANLPVARVRNVAGYYTLPYGTSVTVALTAAGIDTDPASPTYLQEQLDGVYANPDPRSYPLSGYSYAVIPTAANDPKMTTAKRQTLADYLAFGLCAGQVQMAPIGYASLPENLIAAGLHELQDLNAADPIVDLSSDDLAHCQAPYLDPAHPSTSLLLALAPSPRACDRSGGGPCPAAYTDTSTAVALQTGPDGTQDSLSVTVSPAVAGTVVIQDGGALLTETATTTSPGSYTVRLAPLLTPGSTVSLSATFVPDDGANLESASDPLAFFYTGPIDQTCQTQEPTCAPANV